MVSVKVKLLGRYQNYYQTCPGRMSIVKAKTRSYDSTMCRECGEEEKTRCDVTTTTTLPHQITPVYLFFHRFSSIYQNPRVSDAEINTAITTRLRHLHIIVHYTQLLSVEDFK